MKKIKLKIAYSLIILVSVLSLGSCADDTNVAEKNRLFRPVLKSVLTSQENKIIINISRLKDAVSYKFEVSSDEFVTVKTIDSKEPTVIFNDLEWSTAYKVRAISIAADPAYNSQIADLGTISTAAFPSILKPILAGNIIDTQVKVQWNITGNPVTQIKFYLAESLPSPTPQKIALATPVKAVNNDVPDTGEKLVSGLTAATNYIVAVFSDNEIRGFSTFTTGASIPTTGNVIDKRGDSSFDPNTDDGTYLKNIINTAMAMSGGATIILDGAQTYKIGGIVLSNNISIIGGYSLTGGGTNLTAIGDIQIASNANIDKISFKNVKLTGTQSYFIYPRAANTGIVINSLEFIDCTIDNFRGLARMQPVGLLNNYKVDNCIIKNTGDNGLYKSDGNTFVCKNFTFSNSTFYKANRIIVNSTPNASGSVTIDGCTFSESLGSSFLADYSNASSVLSLTLKNTIFGPGNGGTGVGVGPYSAVRLVNKAPGTAIVTNVWDTSEVTYSGTIPGTIIHYTGTYLSLFTDPVNANFKIKDAAFLGKSNAGDPRWRL